MTAKKLVDLPSGDYRWVAAGGSNNEFSFIESLVIVVDNAAACAVTLADGSDANVIFNDNPGGGINTYQIYIGKPVDVPGSVWTVSCDTGVRVMILGRLAPA